MLDTTDPLISIAQAAAEIGVNKSTLSRQVKSGAVRSHSGKVRLSEVLADRAGNIDLTRSSRRAGKMDSFEAGGEEPDASKVDATVDATPDATDGVDATLDEADATVIVDGAAMTYGDARALKETYLARLKKLEFETKRGALAPLSEMLDYLGREYGVVRERLLAIPGKLANDLDREQIRRLSMEIREALEDLHERGAAAELQGGTRVPDDGEDADPETAPEPEPRPMGRAVQAGRAKDKRRAG